MSTRTTSEHPPAAPPPRADVPRPGGGPQPDAVRETAASAATRLPPWPKGPGLLRRLVARVVHWLWPGPWYPNVFWMLHSIWLARAVYVAARLGIADRLAQSPRTAGQLAELTATHAPSLERILRALAAFGVLAVDRQGRYRLTRRGRCLRSDVPDSMRWWAIKSGEEGWQATCAVLEAVRTGQSGFRHVHGVSSWEYYAANEAARENFIRAMDTFTQWQSREIAAAGDFGRFEHLVDVGGGRGALLAAILERHPHARGTVFDLPETIVETRRFLASVGLADRCQAVGGSFLEEIPEGADAYLSKHSLRDWNDEHVVRILRNIHRAMPPDATLLVIDAVLEPAGGQDRLAKLLDVELLVEEGGGMRTRAEFESLLAQAGFRLSRVRRTSIEDAVILEARKLPAVRA